MVQEDTGDSGGHGAPSVKETLGISFISYLHFLLSPHFLLLWRIRLYVVRPHSEAYSGDQKAAASSSRPPRSSKGQCLDFC